MTVFHGSISVGDELTRGSVVVARDGRTALYLDYAGNLVILQDADGDGFLEARDFFDGPVAAETVTFEANGAIVARDAAGSVLGTLAGGLTPATSLQLQDSGNILLLGADGETLHSSGTNNLGTVSLSIADTVLLHEDLGSEILPQTEIHRGDIMLSQDGKTALLLDLTGNLVLLTDLDADGQPEALDVFGGPIEASYVKLNNYGKLVAFDENSSSIATLGPTGATSGRLIVDNDGTLILLDSSGATLVKLGNTSTNHDTAGNLEQHLFGESASISGRYFLDVNHNDIEDAGDTGLADHVVRLIKVGSGIVGSTVTAADGSYEFDGLKAGRYFVRFESLPPEAEFVFGFVGENSSIDSDVNHELGQTPIVNVQRDTAMNDIDAGVRYAASGEEDPRTISARLAASSIDLEGDGEWTGVFDWGIIGIHTILTPDYQLLTFGSNMHGMQGGQVHYSVYDYNTGTLETLTHTTQTDLFCSVAAYIIEENKVLISGGDTRGENKPKNDGVNDSNFFDPVTKEIKTSDYGEMVHARWYPTAVTLANGSVVLLGGKNQNGEGVGTPEIYEAFSGYRELSGAYSEDVESYWWYPSAWTLSDGDILIVPRSWQGDLTGRILLMDPSGDGSIVTLDDGPIFTPNSAPAIQIAKDVFLTLDEDGKLWTIDMTAGAPQYEIVGDLGAPRLWCDMVLMADGNVMISGGSRIRNEMVQVARTAYIFDPAEGTLTAVAAEGQPRLYHSTTILMPDGSIMSLGGGAPSPAVNTSGEVYRPAYLYDDAGNLAVRPQIEAAPERINPGQTFTIEVADASAISRITMLLHGSSTHSLNMNAKFEEPEWTVMEDGRTISITPDSNPNYMTPGGWMIFVWDENGVPSEAVSVIIDYVHELVGTEGNDTLSGATDKYNTLDGLGGNDILSGSGHIDIVDAGAGADVVVLGGGNDTGDGGGGADTLFGEEGDDSLTGGDGNDQIDGGDGNDLLEGGYGSDSLWGAAGHDTLVGHGGHELLDGGAGDDSIIGGPGDDTASGGDGSDRIFGGAGQDRIAGGEQDDYLLGATGNDMLFGDGGMDSLYGGADDDTIDAGGGADLAEGGSGSDSIAGGEGNDTLRGGVGNDELSGSEGEDFLIGQSGNDLMFGGADSDRLLGGTGLDTIFGDDGDDRIFAGIGADLASGGAGDDLVVGNDGRDTLLGGTGNDTLVGGTSADVFAFEPASGQDIIRDWEDGVDLIDLSAFSTSFADLFIEEVGLNVRISVGADSVDSITVISSLASMFGAEDFIF